MSPPESGAAVDLVGSGEGGAEEEEIVAGKAADDVVAALVEAEDVVVVEVVDVVGAAIAPQLVARAVDAIDGDRHRRRAGAASSS